MVFHNFYLRFVKFAILIITTTVCIKQLQQIFNNLLVFSSKPPTVYFREVSKPFRTDSIVYLFSIYKTEFVTNTLLTGPFKDKSEIFLNFNLFSINSRSIIVTNDFKILMRTEIKVSKSRFGISDVELGTQNLDSQGM